MKGASANIRAHALSAVAANLENAVTSGVATEINELVRQLSISVYAVKKRLREVG